MAETYKLARCRCKPAHQDPATCPEYGGRPPTNPTVLVPLTLRQLDALEALPEGYTVHECGPHPHPGEECDGWSPAQVRSLDAAYRRLETARRRAERIAGR